MLLLKPDKFSNAGPNWQISNKNKLIASIYDDLKNNLSINIKNFQVLNNLEINSSNILTEINGEKVILKFLKNLSNKDFSRKFNIYEYLTNKNTPTSRLSNLYDRKDIKNFSFEKNILFLEFIDGRYFNGSYSDINKSSESIRSLNKALDGINKNNLEKLEIYPKNSKEILEKFFFHIKKKYFELSSHLRSFILKNKDFIFRTNEINEIIVREICKEKQEAFHIDLHPHNILIQNHKSFIIDIDSIMLSRWQISKGFSFFKLLRQTMIRKRKTNHLKINSINFLKKTCDFSDTPDFWKSIFSGAQIEIMRRILYIFKENIDYNSSEWNEVLEIQIQSLHDLKVIESIFINK